MTNDIMPIQNLIYEIRGQKVMLDSDLAFLYEIQTKALNQAVKRNVERFPIDFMFQLTQEEVDSLRSQFVTSKTPQETTALRSQIATSKEAKGGRRYLPYVFTEHGVLMLSSVLKSQKAIDMNIQIMRTFVKIRQLAIENKDLSGKIKELEQYFIRYAKDNNKEIDKINEAVNYLLEINRPQKIGFKAEE